jgi:hypothetical protein
MTTASTPDSRSGIAVRPATLTDLPAISPVWRAAWFDGHLGQVPDALLAERGPDYRDQRRRKGQDHYREPAPPVKTPWV